MTENQQIKESVEKARQQCMTYAYEESPSEYLDVFESSVRTEERAKVAKFIDLFSAGKLSSDQKSMLCVLEDLERYLKDKNDHIQPAE